MGFWGSFMVCRSAAEFEDVEVVFDRVGPPVEELAFGGWRFGQFDGQELEQDADEVMAGLVTLTGAPVVMAYVLDSDAAIIDAASSLDDHWRGCLGRHAMRAASEEVGEDFDTTYLAADDAARRAAMWSHDAGLVGDPATLRRLFAADIAADLFIEGDVLELFAALGLPGSNPREGDKSGPGRESQ